LNFRLVQLLNTTATHQTRHITTTTNKTHANHHKHCNQMANVARVPCGSPPPKSQKRGANDDDRNTARGSPPRKSQKRGANDDGENTAKRKKKKRSSAPEGDDDEDKTTPGGTNEAPGDIDSGTMLKSTSMGGDNNDDDKATGGANDGSSGDLECSSVNAPIARLEENDANKGKGEKHEGEEEEEEKDGSDEGQKREQVHGMNPTPNSIPNTNLNPITTPEKNTTVS
jgi:hypothetical protein